MSRDAGKGYVPGRQRILDTGKLATNIGPLMAKHELTANSLQTYLEAQQLLAELWERDHYLDVCITTGKTRSDKQRAAIEVFCRLLAKALNDAGLDQREVYAKMKEGVEIPWSQESAKDGLWRNIQRPLLNKESTTQLERSEVDRVYNVLNRWLSTTFGLSVPFPSRED
jgi:hypothetical protein